MPTLRHERSTAWFKLYRRGGRVILHHGHIQPVFIRAWSPNMDGIAAAIWASQTTLPLGPDDRLNLPEAWRPTASVNSRPAARDGLKRLAGTRR